MRISHFEGFDRAAVRAWRKNGAEGVAAVMEKNVDELSHVRFEWLSRWLRKHPGYRGPYSNYLLFRLVVDSQLTEIARSRTSDSDRTWRLRQLLVYYLDHDRFCYPLCPHAQPESDGDEEEYRWKRIERAFKRLTKEDRLEVYRHLVEQSRLFERDDHWILRDLGVHLPLGRRMRALATVVCGEGGTDSCGNHSDLRIFRALLRAATLEVEEGKPVEDPRAREARKRYLAQPL